MPLMAWAAAWTLPQGQWQYIQNISVYSTTRYFDASGQLRGQPRYTKAELNPYAEMGWRDGTTLGATLSLDAVTGTNLQRNVHGTNIGVADPAVFVRQRLWQGERMVFSVQPLLKLPSYFADDVLPHSGTKQFDAELRMLCGGSFPLWGREHFVNLEVAYRYRFGQPQDQLLADATLGLSLAEKWKLMPQLSYIHSLGDIDVSAFTQSPQDDFDLMKPQLSLLYQLYDNITLQAGAFSHLRGKNTGAGEGVFLSAWIKP